MGDDWKERLDRYRRQTPQQEQQEKAKKLKKPIAKSVSLLEEHKLEFYCAIGSCPIRSKGPAKRHDGTSDWSTPTGLYKCTHCKRWACEQHYHDGLCIQCAEKLVQKGKLPTTEGQKVKHFVEIFIIIAILIIVLSLIISPALRELIAGFIVAVVVTIVVLIGLLFGLLMSGENKYKYPWE
jgi:DNA-directed RNA polymerase subunit RPC12/RpoP